MDRPRDVVQWMNGLHARSESGSYPLTKRTDQMLAPLILPLQINCVVVALITLAAAVLWDRQAKRAVSAVALGFLTGFILFIPSLFVVGAVVDAWRYGKFEYASGAEIRDRYVEIPESATNVTLHKYASGHEVRFQVDEVTLLAWMDFVTKKRGDFSKATPFEREEQSTSGDFSQHEWERRFGRRHWARPADIVRYKGWHSGRGAGFDVWYSAESQTAYISASYW